MLEIIIIPNFTSPLLFPENLKCILNAMFRCSWCIGNGAIIGLGFRGKSLKQRALIAWSFIRLYKQCLSLEALSCSIDVVASGFFGLLIDLKHDIIQIFSCLHVIKASDDDIKLQILAIRYVLDTFDVGCYFDSWTAFADKWCNCICFWFSHIFLPKHELPVQIGEINSVHVN